MSINLKYNYQIFRNTSSYLKVRAFQLSKRHISIRTITWMVELNVYYATYLIWCKNVNIALVKEEIEILRGSNKLVKWWVKHIYEQLFIRLEYRRYKCFEDFHWNKYYVTIAANRFPDPFFKSSWKYTGYSYDCSFHYVTSNQILTKRVSHHLYVDLTIIVVHQ